MMSLDDRGAGKIIRIIQVPLLLLALWFVYWAHIYEMIYWNKTFLESVQTNLFNVIIYVVFIIVVVSLELISKRQARVSSSSVSSDILQIKDEFKMEYKKSNPKKSPSNKLAIVLVMFGPFLLLLSIILSSVPAAFIGLSLTFWGLLFFYARSTKFVKLNVLEASVLPTYLTLDRIVTSLDYVGPSVCVPPYPKDAYLPEHLSGLKEAILFISAKNPIIMPVIEKLSKKDFFIKDPEGICLPSPGSEIVKIIEKELKINLTEIDPSEFDDVFATVIRNLDLAADLKIITKNENIHVTITECIFKHLYSKEKNLKSVQLLGCPLVNAVMCALSIKSRKFVTIDQIDVSSDLKKIEICYRVGVI